MKNWSKTRRDAKQPKLAANGILPSAESPAATLDHVRLGHAGVEAAIRVRGLEDAGAGRAHEVGFQDDDAGIRGGELDERLGVDGSHFLGGH